MINSPKTKKEILSALFQKYGLVYDEAHPESKENDVYKHKHYTIITRSGIQKIEKAAGITCTFDVVWVDANNVFLKVQGYRGGQLEYTTFASASEQTSTNKYYPEMAEKRGRSRIVLTLAGLYELGVFGEDESDDFQKVVKDTQAAMPARYKGVEA